jgi:hypothetical protein
LLAKLEQNFRIERVVWSAQRIPTTVFSIFYTGITLFNSLLLNSKKVAHDIDKFKNKLKKMLAENPFHLVEEYLDRNKS